MPAQSAIQPVSQSMGLRFFGSLVFSDTFSKTSSLAGFYRHQGGICFGVHLYILDAILGSLCITDDGFCFILRNGTFSGLWAGGNRVSWYLRDSFIYFVHWGSRMWGIHVGIDTRYLLWTICNIYFLFNKCIFMYNIYFKKYPYKLVSSYLFPIVQYISIQLFLKFYFILLFNFRIYKNLLTSYRLNWILKQNSKII